MPGDNKPSVRRRQFIKTTGFGATIGLLSGCMGGGNGGNGNGGNGNGGNGNGGNGGGGDNFPEQDIELVIPFGPGGGYDEYSRLVAPYLEEHFDTGINVNPTNVEGAGGEVGANQVYNAEPNGYTNLIINQTNFALTQLTGDTDYELREFTYLPQVTEETRAIAVGSNTDIETWDQYVEAVQNNELNFASTGPGSGYVTVPGTVGAVEEIYPAENVMDNQVVYDGRGEAVQGILAGDAQVLAGSFSSIYNFVESGELRLILSCSVEEEPPREADAETFATLGFENGEQIEGMINSRRIFGAPPDIPDSHAEALREAYSWAIQNDDLQAEAEEMDRSIVYTDSETAKENVELFLDEWGEREDLLNLLFGDE